MSPIEWYWLVYAPIGVTVLGLLLAWIGVKLIEWADRRSDRRVLKRDSPDD